MQLRLTFLLKLGVYGRSCDFACTPRLTELQNVGVIVAQTELTTTRGYSIALLSGSLWFPCHTCSASPETTGQHTSQPGKQRTER